MIARLIRSHAVLRTFAEPVLSGSLFLAMAGLALALSRGTDGMAAIWPANAVLLAALILSRPAARPRHLIACALAGLLANLLGGSGWALSLVFALANALSAGLAFAVLRARGDANAAFESSAGVVRFLLAVGVGVGSGATLASAALWAVSGEFAASWLSWAASDLLGTLLLTPLAVTCIRGARGAGGVRNLRRHLRDPSLRWPLAAVLLVTLVALEQSRFPLLFLPLAVVLIATYRLGLIGAVVGTAMVACIGSAMIATGHGQFTLVNGSVALRIQFFQIYLATIYGTCMPLAAMLTERARLARERAESERRHRRILDRSREVIFETDLAGQWTYLNPAWATLTGRGVDASLGESFLDAIDPRDRAAAIERLAPLYERTVEVCRQELRYTHVDGRVLWASVRSHRLTDEHGAVIGTYGTLHDVTERMEAQAAQAESERLYRLLAENSNDMIVHFDLKGVRQYVSPASLALLGYTPEELVGHPAAGAIHPEDRAAVLATCGTLLDGTPNPICTYRQLHKDGHYVWLEASYRLIRAANENVSVGFIASVRDIGRRARAELERTQAAAELEEANRLLLMAESMSGVGHWRIDLASGRAFWSDTVCAIHGRPPGFAPTLEEALAAYHPDDRSGVEEAVAAALGQGRDFTIDARIVRTDGRIRHITGSGRAETGPTGAVLGVLGVFQDVTEAHEADAALYAASERLRASEARFRLITDQASDMIAVHDTTGRCVFVSPASRTVLGYAPAEMLGKRPRDFAPAEDHPALDAYLARVRGSLPGTVATLRFRMRHADGALRWMEVAARRAQYERQPALIAVARDVTEQVHAEDALREARAQAEAAARAKSTFLANMSHEIRTPMNGVVGFTELLLASDLDPEQRRQAELIADSSRAMMRLLNDILDLSKVEAGQMSVAREPFDLVHALKACMTLIAPAAERKGLALHCDFAADLPKTVTGDALRLRQIVLNLLGNAAKFTLEGGITLTAAIEGERLAIAVRDTGIGIARDRQQAIFEQFVQADGGTALRFGGTGLGLAISQQLAQLMGGTLTLDSVLGEGTCFTLALPLAEMTTDRAVVADTPEPMVPALQGAGSRILVAEDHDVNQMLISAMLEKLGCTPDLAVDGEAAVAMVEAAVAARRPYALVFMDMQMPRLDGIAATRRIRERGIDATALPIVALTANAYADDIEACLAAGMQAHVGKPFSLESLEAALRRWLPVGEVAAFKGAARFSPKIQERYGVRKRETLERLDALVRAGTFEAVELDEVAALLHKLAGTAEMFGDVTLGTEARRLETGLDQWFAGERAERIVRAVEMIRRAA